jgi:hypothetical protein
MKLLYVTSGDDYAALRFQELYGGRTVADILENIDDITVTMEEHEDIELEVIEVGDVDERFIKFIRDEIQDYDDSKHKNFYLETQTV